MKSLKENRKGITLVSLVITIVVLLILASIATYSGIEVIKSSRLTTFTTEMKIMQTQVNELYQRYKDGDNTVLGLGKDLGSVSEQANKAFNASGITEQSEYRYFDQNTIKDGLKIEGVEGEFFVNIKTRSVVSCKGFKYEGETYYTLEQLPDGLYNVEYNDKNINVDKPTFDTSVEKISEGKWRVTVSNIQYNGYINKWKVNYKLEGQDSWNTSEDLSFIVNEQGNYFLKIANENVESEKQKKQIGIYVEDGLLIRYDGILNTRTGNNPNATSWEDLSGNNNDGKFINPNNTIGYLKEEHGYEFTNNNDYIISTKELGLEGDVNATFEFLYKWRGFQTNQVSGGLFTIGSAEEIRWVNGEALSQTFSASNFRFNSINVSVSTEMQKNNSSQSATLVKSTGVFNEESAFIYLNGEKKQTNFKLSYGNNSSMNLINTAIQIGRGWQYQNLNRTLNGVIYAVRIYNRVLTDEEIKNNYEIDKLRFNLE